MFSIANCEPALDSTQRQGFKRGCDLIMHQIQMMLSIEV